MKHSYANRLSISQLNMFLQCPTLYRWKYIEKVEVIDTPPYFLLGRAVAEWIENFHRGQILDPDILVRKHFDPLIESQKNETFANKLKSDKAKTIACIKGYEKCYANEFGKLSKATPECEFVIPIGNRSELFGKIDLIYKSDTEGWVIRETKTATNPQGAYFTRLPLDWQINSYAWASREVLKRPVNVVEYDVINKPSHRIKVKETWEEFTKRVSKEYMDPTQFSFRFFRHNIVIDDRQLKRWWKQANIVAKQIEKAKDSNGATCVQNSTQCNSSYGACSMLQACISRKPSKLLYKRKESYKA